MYMQIYIKT